MRTRDSLGVEIVTKIALPTTVLDVTASKEDHAFDEAGEPVLHLSVDASALHEMQDRQRSAVLTDLDEDLGKAFDLAPIFFDCRCRARQIHRLAECRRKPRKHGVEYMIENLTLTFELPIKS